MAEEAVEQSVEDWAADKFFGKEAEQEVEETEEVEDQEVEASDEETGENEEVEETEASEESEEEEQPEFVEVEYDGQLYEVPPQLKEALLRQSDYTQKTQEVANQRKAVEAEQARIAQEREQYEFINSVSEEVGQIQQIDAAIPQWKQYLRENIDNLSATEIEKIRLQVDELSTQKEAIQSSLKAKYGEFQQAQEQSRKELLDKSTEVLRSKFPDWDGEKVTDYAKSLGFTEDQIQIAQTDPKQMELVRKAMLYDQLQEGKSTAVAKVKKAPQIKAKSRNPMPEDVKAKLNLNKKLKSKNLSASDKARLIGDDIASKFF